MKSKLLWCLVFVLPLSCDKDNGELTILEFNANVLPQKWELFKMTGNVQGSVTEGEAMEWQEAYVLNSDGSFSKIRAVAEGTISGEGTFAFFDDNGEKGLVLTYPEDSGIIGNCSSQPVEYLYLDADQKTLIGTWWACDGPGLFYQRTE